MIIGPLGAVWVYGGVCTFFFFLLLLLRYGHLIVIFTGLLLFFFLEHSHFPACSLLFFSTGDPHIIFHSPLKLDVLGKW